MEDLYVKISWTEPFANYSPITSYVVYLIDSQQAYVEVTSLCDGSNIDNVMNRYCLIPMYEF